MIDASMDIVELPGTKSNRRNDNPKNKRQCSHTVRWRGVYAVDAPGATIHIHVEPLAAAAHPTIKPEETPG